MITALGVVITLYGNPSAALIDTDRLERLAELETLREQAAGEDSAPALPTDILALAA